LVESDLVRYDPGDWGWLVTATAARSQTPKPDEENARMRFPLCRAVAAERAVVSFQEEQALMRAMAEALASQRRIRLAAERG
jgi:hypothetical protein